MYEEKIEKWVKRGRKSDEKEARWKEKKNNN